MHLMLEINILHFIISTQKSHLKEPSVVQLYIYKYTHFMRFRQLTFRALRIIFKKGTENGLM